MSIRRANMDWAQDWVTLIEILESCCGPRNLEGSTSWQASSGPDYSYDGFSLLDVFLCVCTNSPDSTIQASEFSEWMGIIQQPRASAT
jgi:hypothetical protein